MWTLIGLGIDDNMTFGQSGEERAEAGSNDRFWIAPFIVDGEMVGVEARPFKELSPHWIGVCSSLIERYGMIFNAPLQGPLSHLRIKCSAAGSVAMIVLYAHELPVSSFAVVTGADPAIETQALAMFADSIRSSTEQYQVSRIEVPFSEMATLPQRPLMIVVPWPQSPVSEQDRELVKELSWHLAAALIRKMGNDS